MLIIAGRLEVAAAERDAYVEWSGTAVEQARSSPGCLDFSVTADSLDPSRVNIYERWESDAELEAFRGSGPSDDRSAKIKSAEVRKYRISATEDP